MSFSIALVCEAADDATMASALLNCVFERHRPSWYQDTALHELVAFRGFRTTDPDAFLRWSWVNNLYREHASGKLVRGRFTGDLPDHPEALTAFRAIRLLGFHTKDDERPDAIVVLKDTDSDTGRRSSLQTLNSTTPQKPLPTVIGVVHPERECWLLAGFEPQNKQETDALDQLCRELSLHPCREPERLAAAKAHEPRHPKRVLSVLTGDNPARIHDCLSASFDVLEQKGRNVGLADFLRDARERLIHTLCGGPPPSAN